MTAHFNDVKEFIYQTLESRLASLDINREQFDNAFPLIQSGVIDSLGFLELVVAVEDEFNVELDFENSNPGEFTTLAGFIRCIKGISHDEEH